MQQISKASGFYLHTIDKLSEIQKYPFSPIIPLRIKKRLHKYLAKLIQNSSYDYILSYDQNKLFYLHRTSLAILNFHDDVSQIKSINKNELFRKQ